MAKRLTDAEIRQKIDDFNNSTDADQRSWLYQDIWETVERLSSKILAENYGDLYKRNIKEMQTQAMEELFIYINQYDPSIGPFTTFARRHILHGGSTWIYENVYNISNHFGSRKAILDKAIKQLELLGQPYNDNTLAVMTGIPIRTIRELKKITNYQATTSVDEIFDNAETSEDKESILPTGFNSPETTLIINEEREKIHNYLGKLDDLTREIILWKYGFKTGREEPEDAIAKNLSLSKDEIRQRIENGRRDLKRILNADPFFADRAIKKEITDVKKHLTFISELSNEDLLDAQMFMMQGE